MVNPVSNLRKTTTKQTPAMLIVQNEVRKWITLDTQSIKVLSVELEKTCALKQELKDFATKRYGDIPEKYSEKIQDRMQQLIKLEQDYANKKQQCEERRHANRASLNGGAVKPRAQSEQLTQNHEVVAEDNQRSPSFGPKQA